MIPAADKLKIVYYPDAVLTRPAAPVVEPFVEWLPVVEKMREIMKRLGGVGIAAPQVGVSRRFFVAKLHNEDQVFFNPVLIFSLDKPWRSFEGCLSLPGVRASVERSSHIGIGWHDMDNRYLETEIGSRDARIWLHEFDHLDGVLITDHMPEEERRKALAKFLE